MSQASEAFARAFAQRPSGGDPLAARRREAFERFTALGIPTTRDEAWRFTPLRGLEAVAWASAEPAELPAGVELPRYGPRLVFVNGRLAGSETEDLPPGVRVGSLAEALRQSDAPSLGALADDKARAFSALNTASFEDGALVEWPDECAATEPLHVVWVHLPGAEPQVVHPRTWIRAGAGSRLVVIEQHLALGAGPCFSNAVREISVGRNASVEHVLVQDESADSFHVSGIDARQEGGSRFVSHSCALGARLSRVDVRAELGGEHAHAGLYGLYLGRRDQHVDHHTTVDHATPHTTSDELYKGILDDRAHAVFHGRVDVRPHAQKISAAQQNRNLLLSDRCVVNTKPQLEIHADDVRCTHGAAIGQLDPDQLFYLRARGVEAARARALLTFGFASEVLAHQPIPALRDHLEARVLGWLPGAGTA